MSTSKANDSVVTVLTNRVNAVQKYLKAEKATIPVEGKMMTAAMLLAVYQKSLASRADVGAKRAAYKGALSDRKAAETFRLAADESVKGWVLARFGAESTEASEFGFAARKAPQVSAETKALAVQKRKATRDARTKSQNAGANGGVVTSSAPAPLGSLPASTGSPPPTGSSAPVSNGELAPANGPAAAVVNAVATHS
jgi:hypothetical protein